MRYAILLLMSGFALSATAQLSQVVPDRPVAGQQISLTYDPQDPQATLKDNSPIFARITRYGEDGGIIKKHVQLQPGNGKLSGKYRLPENSASFKVDFYTLNKDDPGASHTSLVYTTDRQRPVQGAYQDALFCSRPDSIFQLEVANYPQNYLAYAKYINVVSMIKDPDVAKPQILELLKYLQQGDRNRNAGLLTALCIANAKAGDLTSGKKYLNELFERYPKAQETAFAFSIYNYEYYKASTKEVEEDVRQKLKDLFTSYPAAPISRDENVFHYLEKEQGLTVQDFERVLLPKYADSTVSYHGLTSLPGIYIAKGRPEAAVPLLKMGTRLFQDGSINHQFRLGYGHYQMYVPVLLMELVKANLLQNDLQQAILNSSAAIDILRGSNTEGNFLPLLLPLRAQAYQLGGNYNLALEDYKQLYRSGTTGATDSIRKIFSRCDVKQRTADELLITLKGPSATGKTPAPELTAYDLQGKPLRLNDLKGKLVVINIWGIGCGPCIAEMPDLNELVKRFPDRNKVVFLGISGDPTESLKKFLKTHHYDYIVVNKVMNLAEKFNTNSLPVHLLIGKQGEIISRSIGARADIREYLSGLIERNL